MTVCEVHGDHRPRPLGLVVHHLQPLGMGGPDVAGNRVTVCPTGHLNVHRILDDLLHDRPPTQHGTHLEHKLARQGYDAWVAAGKPGHPVFELADHFGGTS